MAVLVSLLVFGFSFGAVMLLFDCLIN